MLLFHPTLKNGSGEAQGAEVETAVCSGCCGGSGNAASLCGTVK